MQTHTATRSVLQPELLLGVTTKVLPAHSHLQGQPWKGHVPEGGLDLCSGDETSCWGGVAASSPPSAAWRLQQHHLLPTRLCSCRGKSNWANLKQQFQDFINVGKLDPNIWHQWSPFHRRTSYGSCVFSPFPYNTLWGEFTLSWCHSLRCLTCNSALYRH